jgi:hypothetical protein
MDHYMNKDDSEKSQENEVEDAKVSEIQGWLVSDPGRISKVFRSLYEFNENVRKIATGINMDQDNRTILQIDATAVVGVLFFLTFPRLCRGFLKFL